MHIELAIAALPRAQPMPGMPALERLAARGRRERSAAFALETWLAAAFGLAETPFAAGALALLGAGRDPGNAFWLRADPVHLAIGSDGASLTPAEGLGVTAEESAALVAALNHHCGGEYEWIAVQPGRWCVRAAQPLALETALPAQRSPGAAEMLPRGDAAARARTLITEVQMLLHAHPVNAARGERGTPAINSVWLWGAGALPAKAAAPWTFVFADDPLAAGLARLAGIRHEGLPERIVAWPDRLPGGGRVLCVLDPCPEALALEHDWFAPLLEALRADRIGMVTLHVPGAGWRWETARSDLRRFWRRPGPLIAAP